ncbi:MAG: hypothetical protein Q4B79_02475 [Moraxella sp.]|uniref:hypothetical protein n=1 Tax=Moraxella sp. TaxID=479 RepID=UPI0026DDA6C6|nr:hypothetical protein [Moraxella sp.]MDO4449805.1 hypothetical protein [Moraxella sp.]
MGSSSEYKEVIVETYAASRALGDTGRSKVRVRPIAGQGIDTNLKVECSKKMREMYPVGTKFKLSLKTITPADNREFLYAHFNAPYEVLTDEEVTNFLNKKNL